MTHCIHCGYTLEDQPWPRKCEACNLLNYNSPKPVVALILRSWNDPQHPGILVVKRGIEPHKNQWALPGGYIDYAEDWQAAAAREAKEELGVTLDSTNLRLVGLTVTDTNFLVLFVEYRKPITKNEWYHFDFTRTPSDTGQQEILDIQVFNNPTTQPLGIPSHNAFWQKIGPRT